MTPSRLAAYLGFELLRLIDPILRRLPVFRRRWLLLLLAGE